MNHRENVVTGGTSKALWIIEWNFVQKTYIAGKFKSLQKKLDKIGGYEAESGSNLLPKLLVFQNSQNH